MPTQRVGFIGGGTIAGWHADRVEKLGHDVAAIAEIADDVREEFAETYDTEQTFEQYEAMVEEAPLDVVVVAVPNALHADCAIAALDAETNVFVEKPLAHSLEDAERVAEAEARSDGELFVGFMKGFEPGTETVVDAIEAGEFGDIYEVNVEYVRRRGIPQIGSWFTRKNISGGGAVVDIGPHMLHLALEALDFPAIKSVSASAGTQFGDREDYTYLSMWGGDPTDDAEFDVEDHARAMIRTEDDTTIHINVAWASNRAPRQHVEILGDDAGAKLVPGEDSVTVYSTTRNTLSETELVAPEQDCYTAEWAYFFDVLAGEQEHTRNTVEQGLDVQRVIEAIYDSAEQGGEVSVES